MPDNQQQKNQSTSTTGDDKLPAGILVKDSLGNFQTLDVGEIENSMSPQAKIGGLENTVKPTGNLPARPTVAAVNRVTDFMEITREAITKLRLGSIDPALQMRIKVIIASYLKDMRDEIETVEVFTREPKIGGLGLPQDIAEEVVAWLGPYKDFNLERHAKVKLPIEKTLIRPMTIETKKTTMLEKQTPKIPLNLPVELVKAVEKVSAPVKSSSPIKREFSKPLSGVANNQAEKLVKDLPPLVDKLTAKPILDEVASAPIIFARPVVEPIVPKKVLTNPEPIKKLLSLPMEERDVNLPLESIIAKKTQNIPAPRVEPRPTVELSTPIKPISPQAANIIRPEVISLPPEPSRMKPRLPVTSDPSGRANVTDIKLQSRLIGPIEELKRMTLEDFRRIAKTSIEAAEKIKQKIELLEQQDGFAKKMEGVAAWQESELYKLYVACGRQAIEANRKVSDWLNRPENKSLRLDEFMALMGLNKGLKY